MVNYSENEFVSKGRIFNFRLTFESVLSKMQGDLSELKTSTAPTKYVKNHAGAKLLAAGYTKGLLTFQVRFRLF